MEATNKLRPSPRRRHGQMPATERSRLWRGVVGPRRQRLSSCHFDSETVSSMVSYVGRKTAFGRTEGDRQESPAWDAAAGAGSAARARRASSRERFNWRSSADDRVDDERSPRGGLGCQSEWGRCGRAVCRPLGRLLLHGPRRQSRAPLAPGYRRRDRDRPERATAGRRRFVKTRFFKQPFRTAPGPSTPT